MHALIIFNTAHLVSFHGTFHQKQLYDFKGSDISTA